MDLLDDYLSGVRASGAIFCRSVVDPPWAVRFTNPAPLALGVMVRGDAWVVPAGMAPVRIREGDIVLVRGTRSCTVGDRPDTEPQIVVESSDQCRAIVDGVELNAADLALGPRTYGFSPDGSDLYVTAEYPMRGDVCERLLTTLPDVAVVPSEVGFTPLLDLLATEVDCEEPGQQIVLDRLLDLLLVRALRSWFSRPDAEPPAGYRALGDPRIGRALRLLHEQPGRPWTVAALAAEVDTSRAVFARRFSELVGQPPLAYLTEWRMTLAADLLREPGASVASVARRVGYADGFAFSNAFKRVRGLSPSAFARSRGLTPAPAAPA
jgi:AraC-like DNA-binding protein